tara:strand:+ start:62 stop:499 length:438 start_codon:yes stop_codon:yes gene_type:complete
MATTGVFNGTKILFQISTDGGGSFTTVGHSTSASISFSMDTPEATSKDSGGYSEVIAGVRSVEISFDGVVAYDDSFNVDNFIDFVVGPSNGRVKVKASFGTATSGDKFYTVDGFFSSLEYSSEAENPVTYSGSFVGTGAVTTATR